LVDPRIQFGSGGGSWVAGHGLSPIAWATGACGFSQSCLDSVFVQNW
jgi:hypothetical protein